MTVSPASLIVPCSPADAVMVYSSRLISAGEISSLSSCGDLPSGPVKISVPAPASVISIVNVTSCVEDALTVAPAQTDPDTIFPSTSDQLSTFAADPLR